MRTLSTLVSAILAITVAGCTGSDDVDRGPGFENVSELNAIWSLSGTYEFLCNDAPVSVTITAADVYVFNGNFDAFVPWPQAVCSVSSVHLIGAINANGKISGTAALPNGALSDSISGSCNLTSCEGETVNTTEFAFSMTKTAGSPFDGTWGVALNCGGGVPYSGSVSVAGGQFSGPNSTTGICVEGQGLVVAPQVVSETFTLAFTPDGGMTATLTQGTAASITVSGMLTTLTNFSGSGNITNSLLNLNRNDPD